MCLDLESIAEEIKVNEDTKKKKKKKKHNERGRWIIFWSKFINSL